MTSAAVQRKPVQPSARNLRRFDWRVEPLDHSGRSLVGESFARDSADAWRDIVNQAFVAITRSFWQRRPREVRITVVEREQTNTSSWATITCRTYRRHRTGMSRVIDPIENE